MIGGHRHPNVLVPGETCLVVIDIQERFRPLQENFPAMVGNAVRLARTFRILDLPILVTEQYPQGLGPTVAEVKEALGEGPIHAKTCFSGCGTEDLWNRVRDVERRQFLVCGIEAHVCVSQTVHDLLHHGLSVQVAVDAVESRNGADREVALRKMERSGAILTTAEMAAFELLGDAAHPRFKEVQALFK
jgi:nicotinamidase-related amidase